MKKYDTTPYSLINDFDVDFERIYVEDMNTYDNILIAGLPSALLADCFLDCLDEVLDKYPRIRKKARKIKKERLNDS